ncbi:MAG: hypothetical protein ACYS47_00090 [Planctomycetota bacterium]
MTTGSSREARTPEKRRGAELRLGALLAAAFVFLLAASPALARGGGYDFRNFMDNPPKIGAKAPLLPGYDLKAKRMEMKSFVGKTHLVVIFGALT